MEEEEEEEEEKKNIKKKNEGLEGRGGVEEKESLNANIFCCPVCDSSLYTILTAALFYARKG